MKKTKEQQKLNEVLKEIKNSENYIIISDEGTMLVNGSALSITTFLNIIVREMLKRGMPKILVEAAIQSAFEEAGKKWGCPDNHKEELKEIIEGLKGFIDDEE